MSAPNIFSLPSPPIFQCFQTPCPSLVSVTYITFPQLQSASQFILYTPTIVINYPACQQSSDFLMNAFFTNLLIQRVFLHT